MKTDRHWLGLAALCFVAWVAVAGWILFVFYTLRPPLKVPEPELQRQATYTICTPYEGFDCATACFSPDGTIENVYFAEGCTSDASN